MTKPTYQICVRIPLPLYNTIREICDRQKISITDYVKEVCEKVSNTPPGFCRHCSNKNPENALICRRCGSRLAEERFSPSQLQEEFDRAIEYHRREIVRFDKLKKANQIIGEQLGENMDISLLRSFVELYIT